MSVYWLAILELCFPLDHGTQGGKGKEQIA
jgi:hypothetical protein